MFLQKTAQMLARHSDIRLKIEVYTHVDQNEQVDAMRKFKAPDKGRRKGELGPQPVTYRPCSTWRNRQHTFARRLGMKPPTMPTPGQLG